MPVPARGARKAITAVFTIMQRESSSVTPVVEALVEVGADIAIHDDDGRHRV